MQNLGLLVAHRIGIEGDRRLHRCQGEQLEEVIGNHVPQRPGCFVKAAALFHAYSLRGGDLHAVDELPVPQRFRNAVCEPEHHQVLHRLLAQVVIDAVDLLLAQDFLELAVQLLGRIQISSKRFFHDDPGPPAVGLLCQASLAQLLRHGSEKLGGHRQIEEPVSLRGVCFFRSRNLYPQLFVSC